MSNRPLWKLAWLGLILFCPGPWAARGQVAPALASPIQARSFSGQFIVSALGSSNPLSRQIQNLETNADYVRLSPSLVSVSCERIKQILNRQLALPVTWKGQIFIALYAASSGRESLAVTSVRFRDGWRYQLALPDVVKRREFVRGIIEVLLLEAANREAGDHSAEIPAWLSIGLAEEVLRSNEMEIILPPPSGSPNGLVLATRIVDARKKNPLEAAHAQLQAGPALTFQQLSWPAPEQIDGDQAGPYRSSAQVFVNELLWMKDGRECLRSMLTELPRYYNWQFAFLSAFRNHFARPLEVEKWWALHLEHFTGRDLAQTWPPRESWEKLDQTVRSAVEVRVATNALPMHTEVKLQTIIQEWDKQRQNQALRAKLRELEMLRLRLAPELVALCDAYREAITIYLHDLDKRALPFFKRAAQNNAVEQAIRQLNELDLDRQSAKPSSAAVPIQASAAGRAR